jgi:hypothetical protein
MILFTLAHPLGRDSNEPSTLTVKSDIAVRLPHGRDLREGHLLVQCNIFSIDRVK